MNYELIELESGFAVKGFVVKETDEAVYINDSANNTWEMPKDEISLREDADF